MFVYECITVYTIYTCALYIYNTSMEYDVVGFWDNFPPQRIFGIYFILV